MKPLVLTLLASAILCSAYAERSNSWNVESGFIGDAANWSPAQTPDLNGKERWDVSNNGTAKVSGGQSAGVGVDLLVATSARNGTILLEGDGSLQIKRYLVLGHSGKGTGTLTLNDTSTLSIANGEIGIGQRGTGIATVAKGANITLEKGTVYISEGKSGELTLAGTLSTTDLTFGPRKEDTTDHQGKLIIEPGATLKVGKETTFNGTGEFIFRVNGSGSQVSVASLKTNEATVIQFEADASGVSTINADASADISGAKLQVNIDAYKFPSSSAKLVLLKAGSLTGNFAAVEWLGKTQGKINYDAKGEVSVSPSR